MAETTIEVLIEIEVVEWFDEMSPIQVSVDTEHLAKDGLADIEELRWETATFSNPVAGSRELG